ncbi:hypothetical protein U8C37_24140 (plasmid) [Sinorhizobium medicae]|uniref:hypothetical protein n=1 Tax=Sinorhizobium medicae TaxID=110321 RepID=UPI002AF6A077|nr:hypothetical protein [Sinorhizobium medicae]WQO87887.1 hypothetical protein U8C37_24140 [Sinorhizobium medicae]
MSGEGGVSLDRRHRSGLCAGNAMRRSRSEGFQSASVRSLQKANWHGLSWQKIALHSSGRLWPIRTRGWPVPDVELSGRARRHRHNEHGLMEASFSVEMPQALVVDRDGYIASIDQLNDLHGVLCLTAPWRTSAQAKAAERERTAEDEPKTAKEALKKQIEANLAAAEEIEDRKTALDAIEEGVALDPDNFSARLMHTCCSIKCTTSRPVCPR